MKLQSLAERELIRAIRKEFSESRQDVILGIGDDAAVVQPGKRLLLLTKDLLFEDYHFIPSLNPPYFLGRKSLNVNLSDIAAMGGKPKFALLGLGLPSATDTKWLEEYFSGFKSAAKEWNVILLGGDVSESKKISISVTIIGEGKNVIRRSGAKPGHLLYVSGYLGDAKQGFLLLKKGWNLGKDKKADPLLRAFLDPVPQISLGQELSRHKLASSMIDLSDGLSVDLFHLCQESGLGAEIYLERLPLSPEIQHFEKKPRSLALHGGEDYQLLFSVAPRNSKFMLKLQKKYHLASIGRMTGKKGIYVIDSRGKRKPLEIKGYEHFVRKRQEALRRKKISIV
jgi:thiamine-monophosphate kinase